MCLIGPVPAPVPALYIASRSACNACGHGLSSSEMPDPERRGSNQPLRAAARHKAGKLGEGRANQRLSDPG